MPCNQGTPKNVRLDGEKELGACTGQEKVVRKGELRGQLNLLCRGTAFNRIPEPFRFLENFRHIFDDFWRPRSLENVKDSRLAKGALKALIFERQKSS